MNILTHTYLHAFKKRFENPALNGACLHHAEMTFNMAAIGALKRRSPCK